MTRATICAVALLVLGCGNEDPAGVALRFRSGSSTSTGGSSTSSTTSTSTSTSTTTAGAGEEASGDGGGSFIEPIPVEDLPRFEVDPRVALRNEPAPPPNPAALCCEITCDTGERFCRDDDEPCTCDETATLACNAIDNSSCANAELKSGCTCADPDHADVTEPQCYRDCGETNVLLGEVIGRPAPGELVPIDELCDRACDPMQVCKDRDAIFPICFGTCEEVPSHCNLVDADAACDPSINCEAGIDEDGPYCACLIVDVDCQCGCSPDAEW